jgi:hypothetical protein
MRGWCRAAVALIVAGVMPAQVAILQIQIVEGEGSVHAAGARRVRPLTVEVTDETGRPAAGAAVTFQLPEEGPGGTFSSGLRTDVVTADERGRASVRGLQLNRIPGRFQIRITASKEQARAGIVSFQYIADPKGGGAAPASPTDQAKTKAAPGGRKKWVLVALVLGAAAGGIAAGASGGSKTAAGGPVAVPVPPAVAPPTSIGPPTITVGKP